MLTLQLHALASAGDPCAWSNLQAQLLPRQRWSLRLLQSRAILGLPVIDYEKHCQFQFGSYVQVFESQNPCNTTAARTLDCIYLRPITTLLPVDMKSSTSRLNGSCVAMALSGCSHAWICHLQSGGTSQAPKDASGLKIQSKFTKVTYPAKVDDDYGNQHRHRDANQTRVATITTTGESESDSEDDSDSDTNFDSNEDELDDDITADIGDTPDTFDNKTPEPEEDDNWRRGGQNPECATSTH